MSVDIRVWSKERDLGSICQNTVYFTDFDIEQFLILRKRGVSKHTIVTLNSVTRMIKKNLNGVINQTTLAIHADDILATYKSASSIHKYFMYTRNFLKYLYKIRMDTNLLAFLAIFEKPKVRRERKLMTTRIITIEDIKELISRLERDENLTDYRKLQFKTLFLFLAYSGQRQITAYRTTAGQFREALTNNPPVLTIKAEHDKNKMAHYAPLHPEVIPYIERLVRGKDDDEIIFNIDRLEFWLANSKIPLIHTNGKWEIKDLRKFFEQKSDEIGFTDANKNFIMSHGVSSINWTSYKQFLPENVYVTYMKCWRDISLV